MLNLWYVGLSSVDLHLRRVASRVKRGGHPIPEEPIRRCWISSRVNRVKLLPCLCNLRVFDSSAERGPDKGEAPEPRLVLSVENRTIEFPGPAQVKDTPEWARSIVVAAFKTFPHPPYLM